VRIPEKLRVIRRGLNGRISPADQVKPLWVKIRDR
jgi:hypothetical protein